MKPFDLEAALRGEPVITRNGHPYKLSGYNPQAEETYQLVGWANGKGISSHADGKYLSDCDDENGNDLFMVPKERKEWIVRCVDKDDNILILLRYSSAISANLYAAGLDDSINVSIHEITIIE